jgi:hypothetical protein
MQYHMHSSQQLNVLPEYVRQQYPASASAFDAPGLELHVE